MAIDKTTKIIGISVLAVAVILFIINIFFMTGVAINDDYSIVIGSLLRLTGEDGSNWGVASKNGIDLAVKDINTRGGILGKNLVVDHQDYQGNIDLAVNAFRNLVDVKGIDIIIGTTWTPEALALMNIADYEKVIMISPSLGVKEFNENSPYLFNTWPHDFLLSEKLAEIVYEKGYRKVAIIGEEQPWTKEQTNAFTKRFESLGGDIVLKLEPLPGTTEVTTEALKIKNSDADVIVATSGSVLVGINIIKRAKEIGVDLPIYSVTVDDFVIKASDGAYEDMIYLTSLTPDTDFKNRYEDTYNLDIVIGADTAYDAVMLIAKAIEETGSTNTEILQKYLNNIKEYQGVSGHLKSDGKGGFTKDFVIMKVVDGKAVEIQE